MSVDSTPRILEEYDENCELYEAFTLRLDDLICELIEINDLNVVSVTHRLKERDKLEKKIKKSEDKYSCLGDITDISGLRIITYFANDVDRVAEIIQSEFEVDWENSVDRREIMKSNQFGYMSLHYIVSLSEPRASLSENQRFNDCKCEIQIRSILQHAWAEIEHDMGYKTELEIPQQTRRRFTRIAGLLEVADSEFDAIRLSLSEYREEVGRRIIEDPAEVLIDKDSLMHFMNTDPILKSINLEIAQQSNHIFKPDTFFGHIFVDELDNFGIVTISEFREVLEEKREILVKYAVDWLTDPRLSELYEDDDTVEKLVGPEIALHYLFYVLCGEHGKNDLTISFLENKFPTLANDESFIDRIFNTYNRLIQE